MLLQVHVSDSAVDGGAGRLASVTDRHELDQFLCDALLKETEFEVQHSSMVILSSAAIVKPKADHHLFEYETIPIPRRPHWDADTTHEQLDKAERESFMKWRRVLATMEESQDERQLTPFEKNLEVWKQLWRVLERSHIVVQILDARNPLLFRSKDLEAYVRELGQNKTCLLVINKADYLTPHARRMWSDYFTAHSIDFVFFSAALEQSRLDDLDRKRRRREEAGNYHGHSVDRVDQGIIKGTEKEGDEANHHEDDDVYYEQDDEEEEDKPTNEDDAATLKASKLWKTEHEQHHGDKPAAAHAAAASSSSSSSSPLPVAPHIPAHQILTRDALFAYITAKFVNACDENKSLYEAGERITVGMVGYPNVGSVNERIHTHARRHRSARAVGFGSHVCSCAPFSLLSARSQ